MGSTVDFLGRLHIADCLPSLVLGVVSWVSAVADQLLQSWWLRVSVLLLVAMIPSTVCFSVGVAPTVVKVCGKSSIVGTNLFGPGIPGWGSRCLWPLYFLLCYLG